MHVSVGQRRPSSRGAVDGRGQLTFAGVVVHRQRTEMVRSPMVPLSMPQKLRFNITPEIKRDIDKAKQNMNMYVSRSFTHLTP